MTVTSFRMTALLAPVALAALSACVKNEVPSMPDEPEWNEMEGKNPVRFSTTLEETKAPLSEVTTNFRIFGFYQPGNLSTHTAGTWESLLIDQWTPNFMYDQVVTYAAGDWSYAPLRYWPSNPENTITFWAYSSPDYTSSVVTLRKSSTNDPYGASVPGLPGIKYTTTGYYDLLVSDIAEDQSYANDELLPPGETVTLNFSHAMCWVDFSVKKVDADGDFDVFLKSITIKDIRSSGVYDVQNGWGGQVDPVDLVVYSSAGSGQELSHSVAFGCPSGDPLLPLPQRLNWVSPAPTLRVIYTFKVHGASGEPTQYTCDIPLGDVTSIWQKGKHYTYNVNVTPGNPIYFTTTVAPWDSWQEATYNVN